MLKLFSLTLCIIFVVSTFFQTQIAAKDGNFQFVASFEYLNWTERRPDYLVNMTISGGTISFVNVVNIEIPSPIAYLLAVQKDGERETTIYNITTRLCDFMNLVNKVPMFRAIAQSSLKQSNYSFDCPMRRGVYALDNLRINKGNPLLGFMYKPKRLLTFHGGLYEELANKSMRSFSTYVLVARIIKKRGKA